MLTRGTTHHSPLVHVVITPRLITGTILKTRGTLLTSGWREKATVLLPLVTTTLEKVATSLDIAGTTPLPVMLFLREMSLPQSEVMNMANLEQLLLIRNTTGGILLLVENTTGGILLLVENTTGGILLLVENMTGELLPLVVNTNGGLLPLMENASGELLPLVKNTNEELLLLVENTTGGLLHMIKPTNVDLHLQLIEIMNRGVLLILIECTIYHLCTRGTTHVPCILNLEVAPLPHQ